MYAHKVNRYTISGTCFGGNEIWTTSFFAGLESADSIAPTDAGTAGVAAAWSTFFTTAASGFSSSYKTVEVKGVQLNTDGKTDLASVKHYTYPSAIAGNAGPAIMPPQITLVATLASGLQRGLASKGRMFLPGINGSIDATGHVSASQVTPTLANLKTFINACNSLSDLGGVVVLASRGRGPIPVIPGPIKAVNQVKLGNVYDTQRRRRNQLVETYSALSIP